MSRLVKLHFPLRHRPELTFDEAQRYWRVQHGPLIRSMAPASGLLRYQQVHRFESPLEDALRAARGTAAEPYTGHAEAVVRARRRQRAGGRRGRTAGDRGRGSLHRPAALGHLGRQGARLRRPHLTRRPRSVPAMAPHRITAARPLPGGVAGRRRVDRLVDAAPRSWGSSTSPRIPSATAAASSRSVRPSPTGASWPPTGPSSSTSAANRRGPGPSRRVSPRRSTACGR